MLRELFAQIRQEYGSVTGYFDSIGVDQQMREKLVEQLTVAEA